VLHNFVKEKAVRLVKWKGKKTAKHRHEKKTDVQVESLYSLIIGDLSPEQFLLAN